MPLLSLFTEIMMFLFFSNKIRLDMSCESSAGQRIHMKHQALFSSKDKRKKKLLSATISIWRFRVNIQPPTRSFEMGPWFKVSSKRPENEGSILQPWIGSLACNPLYCHSSYDMK